VSETRYGFTWGPATVERVTRIERPNGTYRILRVTTGCPSQALDIYISPTGRSVRVFRSGSELKTGDC